MLRVLLSYGSDVPGVFGSRGFDGKQKLVRGPPSAPYGRGCSGIPPTFARSIVGKVEKLDEAGALRTPVCDQLGMRVPVVQAPIGSSTTPELAAAVANAGGLGMLAITWRDPASAAAAVRRTQELTAGAI